MSLGEIVGLMLSVALLSGVVGAALAAALMRKREACEADHARAAEACVRWLAARLTLSRASVSFIAAFRALAAERRDSAYFPLRVEEAQRSRALWSEASGDLDLAEATLIAGIHDPATQQRLAGFDRVAAEALRSAVHGDQAAAEALVQQLRTADHRAIDFVRSVTTSARQGRCRWGQRLAQLIKPIQSLADRWSRR